MEPSRNNPRWTNWGNLVTFDLFCTLKRPINCLRWIFKIMLTVNQMKVNETWFDLLSWPHWSTSPVFLFTHLLMTCFFIYLLTGNDHVFYLACVDFMIGFLFIISAVFQFIHTITITFMYFFLGGVVSFFHEHVSGLRCFNGAPVPSFRLFFSFVLEHRCLFWTQIKSTTWRTSWRFESTTVQLALLLQSLISRSTKW